VKNADKKELLNLFYDIIWDNYEKLSKSFKSETVFIIKAYYKKSFFL